MTTRRVIRFEKVLEEAEILTPSAGFKLDTHEIEHRRDPLTGHRSLVGLRLIEKYRSLMGETDRELVDKLVASSAEKCFFCPDMVMSATPMFSKSIVSSGRIAVGESTLFPNLFPLSLYHAIIVPCKKHFLRPEEFTAGLIGDSLRAAQTFLRGIPLSKELYGSINCNYMPPAGASAVHPHFQFIVSTVPSSYTEETLNALKLYYRQYQSVYWDDLVEVEKEKKERYVGATGPVQWLCTYSPRGMNEILGVCPQGGLSKMEDRTIQGLGEGVSRALKYYGSHNYSAFNMSMDLGRLESDDPWNRLTVRLVTRQNFSAGYRAGEHFFQHMLATNVVVVPPEVLALELKQYFVGE
ncbi:MAG: hypothetical protein C4K49_00840 [Candidatus Thorarchaeota archaeon]|nr:MAG: hypothetical protein C4K49_00840 [Candidatus Thorarchaeota archaeon]